MKNVWVTSSRSVSKPWGDEQRWGTGGTGRISGKILHLKEGCRNSLKYNQIKDETLFILSGKLLLTYSNEKFQEHYDFCSVRVLPGETINIQSGCPYRIKALEDSVIVEIAHRGGGGGNGVVRFHDDYGRHSTIEEYEAYENAEKAEKSIALLGDI